MSLTFLPFCRAHRTNDLTIKLEKVGPFECDELEKHCRVSAKCYPNVTKISTRITENSVAYLRDSFSSRPWRRSMWLWLSRSDAAARTSSLGGLGYAFFDNAFFENAFFENLQIFGGLVLGCIKKKFCKKICVRQHFSSSTRFASFCTAAISKFSQKIGLKSQQFL